MSADRVAAVVVTLNRLPLLQKCIEKLETQTVPCDILVVNNASTDGTAAWLSEREAVNSRIHVKNTGANLGGAGGFHFGMRWAVHAMADNNGSSIATDSPERIERYRYAYRNDAFTYRQEGVKGVCYYLAKCGLNFCRILAKAPDKRGKRIRVLLDGMIRGAFFRPEIESIKNDERER